MKTLLSRIFVAIAMTISIISCSCCTDPIDTTDTVKPATTLEYRNVTTNSVLLSFKSTDNVGVVSSEIDTNGVVYSKAPQSPMTLYGLKPERKYTVVYKAYDAAKNIGQSEITFTTLAEKPDSENPVTTISLQNLTFNSATLQLSAHDDKVVASTEIDTNGVCYIKNPQINLTSGTYTLSGLVSKRDYTVTFIAIDGVGKKGQSEITFTTPSEWTAEIDMSKSYEASANAIDKALFGRSIAKAFVVYVTKAGSAKLETVGVTLNATNPIAYYWITGTDNNDLNVAASTLNAKVAKTAITNSQVINLSAGYNVICFKTSAYASSILTGMKVGLRLTTKDDIFENASYTADGSQNVNAKLKIKCERMSFGTLTKLSKFYLVRWGTYDIVPQDENGNYDGSIYPKISACAFNLANYTKFSNLHFTADAKTPANFVGGFEIEGNGFGFFQEQGTYLKDIVYSDNKPIGTVVNFNNSILNFSGPEIQTKKCGLSLAQIFLNLNLYIDSTADFYEETTCAVPNKGGWKFFGNPEIEVYDPSWPTSNRIY